MPDTKREQVLSVRDLDITFKTTAGPVHAIRGVNIDLYKGETVALVGESGSGKSVTMKAAMGILAQNAKVNSGSIPFSHHPAPPSPAPITPTAVLKPSICCKKIKSGSAATSTASASPWSFRTP